MGKKYEIQNEVSDERRNEIRSLLLAAAGDHSVSLLSEQDILSVIQPESKEIGVVIEELDHLEAEGALIKNKKGRWMLPGAYGLHAGTMRRHRRGFGFVTLDDGSRDVYIPRSGMSHAIDGDRVLIRLFSETQGDHRTGSVEKITSHGVTFATGIYSAGGNYGFVITDSKNLEDIFVRREDSMDAQSGDKVRVQITKYPDDTAGMRGVITEIYGKAGDGRAESAAILNRYEVKTDFSERILSDARKIPQKLMEIDVSGRVDLREEKIITIDGADARDFDDAVRVEKLENGCYRLLVCIADVAHYVKEDSSLDREAFLRGCSIYFPDRVYPMLPEELSNGICSLNQGEDRLTLTAEMEIDSLGEVTNYRIYESVIRSSARMVYSDVSDILENEDQLLKQKYEAFLPMLYDMRDLAAILAKKRYSEGSIDFDVRESHITADEEGNVLSIEPAERRVANKIIEEFMLTANKVIAEHCFWMEVPFLYRIHEKPDQMKMEQLKHFAGSLGLTLKGSCDNIHPKSIGDLLQQAKGSDSEHVISRVSLRSMKKAVYDTECRGHFGLGFRYYCHFTSPIRRYPDLMIHRIIKETLHGVIEGERYQRLAKRAAEAAQMSSLRERAAVDAERAIEKKMKAEYMSRMIGEQFAGIISGVASAGFFVELENTVEGYVPAELMMDDYYIYDEKNYRMIGERTRRVFSIGNRVVVEVDKVNTITDEIDFRLIRADGNKNREKKESKKRSSDKQVRDAKRSERRNRRRYRR